MKKKKKEVPGIDSQQVVVAIKYSKASSKERPT